MAIAYASLGAAGNSSSAVASLALSSWTTIVSQTIVVAVALGSTASSISSITDTKLNAYTKAAAQNGTGIRTEIWTSFSVGAQNNNIITCNITGGNTTIAAAAAEYSGVTGIGNNGVVNGGASTSINMYENNVLTTQASDFVVGALGFACVSGDTLTAVNGTSRQSSIPAATAVGIALYDNTSLAVAKIPVSTRISNARNWATAAVELNSGGAATPVVDYHSGTVGLDIHPTFKGNLSGHAGNGNLFVPVAGLAGLSRNYFAVLVAGNTYQTYVAALSQTLPISGQLFPPSFPPSSNTYS